MVDVSAISGVLSSLGAAKDIAQTMIGLRDTAAFQGKLIEFQSKIIDAQNRAMTANDERTALLETIRKLEEKVADFEAWETEKQKYHLKEVDVGAFAYVLKPDTQTSEPAHWICTTCYGNKKKSLLQSIGSAAPSGGPNFRRTLWKCFTCKSEVLTLGHITSSQQNGT
jgi:hypothetical protein